MPSMTRTKLRHGFARTLGMFWQFTTTTNITTDNNVVCDTVPNKGYSVDDFLIGKWVFILGTANPNVARMVNDYTASSGTLNVRGKALAAESGSKDFELMEFSADRLHDALNAARLAAWPYLYKHAQWDSLSAN